MSPVAAAAAPALTSARPARSGERHGGEDASATAAVTAARPTAEEDDEGRLARAHLGGGWAMDDCEPTEEELEYRQERARHAQQAKPLWLQRLTAVSRLPALHATCCTASSPRSCGSTCRPRCCACPRTLL